MILRIYLLGQFKFQAGNQSIELPSRPAQSLLAYLVLNAGVTHRREKLASMLWPETSESNARSYLRQALWRIRKSLEGGSLLAKDYLQVNDINVTFDSRADYWLDADILMRTTEAQSVEQILEAVQLYRGELLPGFYDEWVILERDRIEAAYHQKMNLLLERLVEMGEWEEVLSWGEHWLRYGHSPEPAFRALMRAHAGLGDLSMVNATYQRCAESLNRELSVEPSPETQQLYERIRQGEIEATPSTPKRYPPTAVQKPAFLEADRAHPIEKPVFVARQQELSQLQDDLDLALASQGRVIFISGEAGSGKTALIQEFTRRAQKTHADLIVVSGNCNAHTGIGDPYLPFREILEMLTGDVESRWAAGAITTEHACLLWNTLPLTLQALVEAGPDLVDVFIPGPALVERANAGESVDPDLLTRLQDLVKRKVNTSVAPNLQQSDLFEQYTRVMQALAHQVPLVLVVDDLQWADLGSISLLFHVGRHLGGRRVLILGAYRSEEIALGREGERHPLESVVNEFQRLYGDILVNVDQAASQQFMDAFLDSEPNQLESPFRRILYQRTRGHPLFTAELLRGMQERGDLVQDPAGQWVEGPTLDWETLPARVEAAIAERIGRLPQPLQAALRVASVEGEEFTAEVVARILRIDEREMVERLSNELDRRHRLVRAQAIERLGTRGISRYRFRHYLTQKYLYDNLDPVERAYLHEDAGVILEQLYGDRASEIAVRLARHFREANISEKAVHYLHRAGDRAVQLSSYQEALTHLTTGLSLLNTLPVSRERNQQELALLLTLGIAWNGAKGYSVPEVTETFTKARELCQQLGDTSQLCRVVGELSLHHYVRAEHQKALELGLESLNLAKQVNDPLLIALGHWYSGIALFCFGEFSAAHTHFEQVIALYNPEQHHRFLVILRGSDAGLSAFAYDACCLWCLGFSDQAIKRSQEALALARALNHPYSLADVICYAGCLLSEMRQDVQALQDYAELLVQLANEKVPGWLGSANNYLGTALANLGQSKEGIALIRQGIAENQAIGVKCYLSVAIGALAEAQVSIDQLEQGLVTLDDSFEMIEESNEHLWEAELYRLRGQFLLLRGDQVEAEASLLKAIEVAQIQQAKAWELRAATDLARLWQQQGRIEAARQILVPVYDWFTEGFDTPDLKAAKLLIQELSMT